MKPVSILEIADHTGYSRNTVAKALRMDDSVSEKTRKRIIRVAYEMGYQKLGSQSLKEIGVFMESERKTYAVLISKGGADFWNKIVMGISDGVKAQGGYCHLNFISQEEEEQLELPVSLMDQELKGIFCLYAFREEYINKIVALGKPVVFLDIPPSLFHRHSLDTVLMDGFLSVYQITKALGADGYREIGFLGDTTYCQSIYDRYRGFLEAMREMRMPVNSRWCITGGVKTKYYEYEDLAEQLDKLQKLPEAFVCANDRIALNVYTYCQNRGIRIPEQMAVTGFDNLRESRLLQPPLTTVSVSTYRLGLRLLQKLMWRIENPEMARETLYVASRVIFRGSAVRKSENQ